jgi:hypothetical protein
LELIDSGGLRSDRHCGLILSSPRPRGVPEHKCRKVLANAKSYAGEKMGEERKRAEALIAFHCADAEGSCSV